MRDLTQQEIDDAPDWATDYSVVGCEHGADIIVWISDRYRQFGDLEREVLNCIDMLVTKPIPRKEFDTGDYEFYNLTHVELNIDGSVDFMVTDGRGGQVDGTITKEDIIVLAKLAKLTSEDLK